MEACKWCGETDNISCDCQERIDCKNKGNLGHQQCGWCEYHKQPKFLCFGLDCKEDKNEDLS